MKYPIVYHILWMDDTCECEPDLPHFGEFDPAHLAEFIAAALALDSDISYVVEDGKILSDPWCHKCGEEQLTSDVDVCGNCGAQIPTFNDERTLTPFRIENTEDATHIQIKVDRGGKMEETIQIVFKDPNDLKTCLHFFASFPS